MQVIKEPNPQMRIAVEIWSASLLHHLRTLGFGDYPVPFSHSRGDSNDPKAISVESFCDFGEDSASQEKAKLFLSALVKYSHADLNNRLKNSTANREAISTAIDDLASKHGMKKPCFGSGWNECNISKRILNFFTRASKPKSASSVPENNRANLAKKA